MKSLVKLGLILSIAVASTCDALSTSQIKIISHKEIVPPSITAYFKDFEVNQSDYSSILKSNSLTSTGNDVISALTKSYDSYGPKADGDTALRGWSLIYISNPSSVARIYDINIKICTKDVESKDKHDICASSEEALVLPAGSEAYLGKQPLMNIKFPRPGQYEFYVSSSIRAEDTTTFFTSTSPGSAEVK